jgi:hypothetical protein
MSIVVDLATVRREREAAAAACEIEVERQVDPDNGNMSFVVIRGASFDAVQSYINGLIAEIESFGNGYGSFMGPTRGPLGLYYAAGKIVAGVSDD